MTTHWLRVTYEYEYEYDSASLWRDIVVGADRTLGDPTPKSDQALVSKDNT